jgi:hypothetical protein
MTSPGAACPNCGAPVSFRYAQAVQTTCPYCRGVLVRHDVNLALVGVQSAALPEDASPIQLGTEGMWRGKSFTVVGRIAYGYELGRWNEWHLSLSDGGSAWLSDAQLEYAITRARAVESLPAPNDMSVNRKFRWDGVSYRMTVRTLARYTGVEGDLPFEYHPEEAAECLFVDLRGTDGPTLATIDYSDEPPTLFTGEFIDARTLAFKNLRSFEGWP